MKHEWNKDWHQKNVYVLGKFSTFYLVLYQKSLKFCPVIALRYKTTALKYF